MRELQLAFAEALTALDPSPDILGAIAGDSDTAQERLRVYRQSLRGAMFSSLEDDFAACRSLVGPDFFAALLRRFVAAVPSRSPDISAYGAALPAFIDAFAPGAAVPYLADVARLEWALCELRRCDPPPVLDRVALASVAPEAIGDLVFRLAPHRLLASRYPVHSIWHMAQGEDDGDGEPPSLDLEGGGERVIIWRTQSGTRAATLPEPTWKFLSAVAAGGTFAVAIAGLELDEGGHAAEIVGLLPEGVTEGWISGFELLNVAVR